MSKTSILWAATAWADYLDWAEADKKIWKRINALIADAQRSPYEGIGKPEALRFDLSGYWSRRINHEHRLVYKYDGAKNCLIVVQCRFHY